MCSETKKIATMRMEKAKTTLVQLVVKEEKAKNQKMLLKNLMEREKRRNLMIKALVTVKVLWVTLKMKKPKDKLKKKKQIKQRRDN
jgi:hypothetical protein